MSRARIECTKHDAAAVELSHLPFHDVAALTVSKGGRELAVFVSISDLRRVVNGLPGVPVAMPGAGHDGG